MRKSLLLCVLMTAACSTAEWAPGPTLRAGDPIRAKAQCDLWARNQPRGGGWAVGPAVFVGAAVVGGAIASNVRRGNDSDDCMLAAGYIRAGTLAQPSPLPLPASAPTQQVVQTSTDGKVRINLPPGWRSAVPPPPANPPQYFAINSRDGVYMAINSVPRADVADINAYTTTFFAATPPITAADNIEKSSVTEITINGMPARRMFYSATMKSNGLRVKFVATIIQSQNRILRISAWGNASNYDAHQQELISIADYVSEATN